MVGPVPVLLRDCWPSLREACPVGEHQEGHLLRYGAHDLIKLMVDAAGLSPAVCMRTRILVKRFPKNKPGFESRHSVCSKNSAKSSLI